MIIAVSRIYYNEYNAIKNTHPKDPAVVQYIDGRFPLFEMLYNSNYSKDGSNKLISSYDNVEMYFRYGTIIEKQNFAFKVAGKFDVVLKLACDERIVGDWNLFCKNVKQAINHNPEKKIFNIKYTVHSGDKRPIKAKPRLFVDSSNFIMGENHFQFLYKGKKVNAPALAKCHDIEGIEIIHDNRVRDKQRDLLMDEYQSKVKGAARDNWKEE